MNSHPLFANNNFAFEQIKKSMKNIGYEEDLLTENYEYADILGNYKVSSVELAGFASIPWSYRNACIGVVTANGISSQNAVKKHRSLGAPLFFVITENSLETWKVTEKGEPTPKETVSHNQISNLFQQNASNWKPDNIFRA